MQKGVSLYITIVIMAILLAIVLGVSAILMNQIKIIRGIENSVIAFHAADTGIERVLKIIMADDEVGLTGSYSETLDNNASYNVEVKRCPSTDLNCNFYSLSACADTPPAGVLEDVNCVASRYCVKSKGAYKGSQRAVEITYGALNPSEIEYGFDTIPTPAVSGPFYDTLRRAQTFTITTSNTAMRIELLLAKNNLPAGNIEVSLQGVVFDPIGGGFIPDDMVVLGCTGSIIANSISSSSSWVEISLVGAGCDLSAGIQYAVVVSAPDADSSNDIEWYRNDNLYTGGNGAIKLGVAAPWEARSAQDNLFRISGCPL